MNFLCRIVSGVAGRSIQNSFLGFLGEDVRFFIECHPWQISKKGEKSMLRYFGLVVVSPANIFRITSTPRDCQRGGNRLRYFSPSLLSMNFRCRGSVSLFFLARGCRLFMRCLPTVCDRHASCRPPPSQRNRDRRSNQGYGWDIPASQLS